MKKDTRPSFDDLIRSHVSHLSRVIAHYFKNVDECEETMQEVITHLLMKFPSYKQEKPFQHWALKITSNFCISKLRKNKIRRFFSLEPSHHQQQDKQQIQPIEKLHQKENQKMVHHAIDTLKPSDREVILLTSIMGHNDQEAASILGLRDVNFRVRKHRSLARLKKILIQMGYSHA